MFTYLRQLLLTLLTVSLATGCEPLPTRSESEQEIASEAFSEEMQICATQPVPSGYVVVSAHYSSTCPVFDQYGEVENVITIRTINTLGSPATICTWVPTSNITGKLQHIPARYVVVGAPALTTCPFYYDQWNGRVVKTTPTRPNSHQISTISSPMTMCKWVQTSNNTGDVQNIPAGYVVVGASAVGACAFYYKYDRYGPRDTQINAYEISTLRSPITICTWWPSSSNSASVQQIPTGYAAVRVFYSPTCAYQHYLAPPNAAYYDSGNPPNAVTLHAISTLGSSATICIRWPTSSTSAKIQPIPAGYAVVGTSSSTDCEYHNPGNPPNTVTISPLSSPATICTRWPTSSSTANVQQIPAGYVVVGASHSTDCAYYDPAGTHNAVTIRMRGSPTTICIRWPTSPVTANVQKIPGGYVVVGVSRSSDCAYYDPAGTPNAVTIRRLASPISICTQWPTSSVSANVQQIPAGYAVVSASHSTDCAYYDPAGTPNVYNIQRVGGDHHDQGGGS